LNQAHSPQLSVAGAAHSDGFDLGIDAALTRHLDLKLLAAYADARYTQTVYFGNNIVVSSGEAIGALPLVPSPFTVSGVPLIR
jgi:hypothetical protein